MSKAGKIEINVCQGGYPVWCKLLIDGKEVASLTHTEIGDLSYAARKAAAEARSALPESYRHEVFE